MRRNWLMSFTEGIRGSFDDVWTGGVRLDVLQGFYLAYFHMDLGPVQMALAWVFTTTGGKSSGGAVCRCTESAVRLLIGH